MTAQSSRRYPWSEDLQERIERVVSVGDVILTLSNSQPNRIDTISRDGVIIETTKSSREGRAQLVPGWMFQVAWDELIEHGQLTNRHLLYDLNVKRSSAVCAVLARLPEVTVASERPIRLLLRR